VSARGVNRRTWSWPVVVGVLLAALLPLGNGNGAVAAAHGARAWDFDGDGRADLAIGASGEDDGAGAVTVIPGTRRGLSTGRSIRFTQDTPGIPGAAESGDAFGSAVASGDFDADGYADLAVSADSEDSATEDGVGGVIVLYGSAAGITADRAVSLGRPETIFGQPDHVQNRLGYLLASADFDRDGHADLVAAVATDGSPTGVLVYRGHDRGIARMPAQQIGPRYGLPDVQQSYTNALAVGDLDGNGAPDLALGWEEVDQAHGAVAVVYAAPGVGLDLNRAEVRRPQVWTRTTEGVKGDDVSDEAFGAAVAIGDVTGDGFGDLVVTALHIPPGGPGTGGAVQVLRGSSRGVTAKGDQLLRYAAIVDGAVGGLGHAVEVGDLDRDGIEDVAVTHASADANAAGAVTVLYGATGGLTRAHTFNQDSPGVGGANRPDVDYWGLSMRIGDAGRSAGKDLIVADPYEPVDGQDAGLVTVLWGSTDGVSGTRSTTLVEGTDGIPDVAESTDRFGIGL
jgi:hypothetical protein